MLELLPIREHLHENEAFASHPDCQDNLLMTLVFFARVGYRVPWIGYYARRGHELVGSGAFKGKPVNNTVEIAYTTFPRFQHQGIGAEICRQLVTLSRTTDPSVRITARTLPEENYSTRILKKNGFDCLGVVEDEDDGPVWQWEYLKS